MVALGWLIDRIFVTDWTTALAGLVFVLNGALLVILDSAITARDIDHETSLSETLWRFLLLPWFWMM